MALLLQSGSTAAMPLVASLPEQPSRRLSFLPMALIFLPLHLSAAALAVLALRVRVTRTPIAAAAANSFILSPSSSPRDREARLHTAGSTRSSSRKVSARPSGRLGPAPIRVHRAE